MKIDLIQPRHNYAPDPSVERFGHVYLPTSLLTVVARLKAVGVETQFHDENLAPAEITSDVKIVGINLLGAPYIPEAIKLQNRMRKNIKTIFGGQVISGLANDQFHQLFGENAVNGNFDAKLAEVLGFSANELPNPADTSLIPAYEDIPDSIMKEYLSREFSFYLSQGCKFACEFCAAIRSKKNPETGKILKNSEEYRRKEFVKKDLKYLVKRAQKLGLLELNIYLSNLDIMQTPAGLLEFVETVEDIKMDYPKISIHTRALARVDTFLKIAKHHPDLLKRLVATGFHSVGFGVDGMTPDVWKKIKKGYSGEDQCIEAIRVARDEFGITPEVLMVFGHIDADTEESLKLAFEFCKDMEDKYGAIPRPHVSKHFIPGNDGWTAPENKKAVQNLIQHPELFQALDFTALPSNITHSDPDFRALVTQYYLKICTLLNNTTKPVVPYEFGMTDVEIEKARLKNEGQYDR